MRVSFRKITTQSSPFSVSLGEIVCSGSFVKRNDGLVGVEGSLQGSLLLPCDLCGEEFELSLDEPFEAIASEGFYHPEEDSENSEFVVEFLDGELDFQELVQGELESVKTDYHVCPRCQNRTDES